MSRPWMPLYVADYLADTRRLTMAEHGAYMLLIMEYWRNGGLPDDEKKLARIVGANAEEWAAVRENVSELFQPGWRHKRIDKELADAEASYSRRAAAGRKGGNAKAESYVDRSNATAMPEQCSSGDLAMLKQSQPQSQSFSLCEKETREARAAVAKEAARSFEIFWDAWPNKTGKPAAIKAFFKVWRETDAIIAGVNRYIRDKPADRPWLNPSTFLNQRRWEDQPAPVANARAGPGGRPEKISAITEALMMLDDLDDRNPDQDSISDYPPIQQIPLLISDGS